jgi:hypothetical protein
VTTSAFAEQDADGRFVHRQEDEQQQELDIVLTRIGQRWLIQQVYAAGAHQGAGTQEQ